MTIPKLKRFYKSVLKPTLSNIRIILMFWIVTVIEEANWLTLASDISHLIGEGFDAVICLGNSFAHMPDTFDDQREQRY